jgi:solute carrier family 13 (sodium-dependent dicarboxylate transporter), member 2/3/5
MVGLIPAFENPIVVILMMAIVTSLASNVMSNTAAASILIPFGALLVPPEYILLMVVTLGFAASTALLLPISTPPNALVFLDQLPEAGRLPFCGADHSAGEPLPDCVYVVAVDLIYEMRVNYNGHEGIHDEHNVVILHFV